MVGQQENPHHILFAAGLIAMVLSVALFGFAFYILPHVFFDWTYDVPEFIIHLQEYFQRHYGMGGLGLVAIIIGPFFIAALALAYISKIVNDELAEYHEAFAHPDETIEEAPGAKERILDEEKTWGSREFGIKILLLIALVFILLFAVEYMLSVDMLSHASPRN